MTAHGSLSEEQALNLESLATNQTNGSQTTTLNFDTHKMLVSVFGEALVSEKHDDIGLKFDYLIPNQMIHGTTQGVTGDGTVTHANNLAVLSSTTGTSYLQSRDTLRYRAGHGAGTFFTASFNGAGSGYIGLFDTGDGFYLKVVNNVLSVGYRAFGVNTETSSFNGDNISSIDLTKINIFYIDFGYLGVANPSFWVMRADNTLLKIHEFQTSGQLTTTHIGTPILPIRMETSGAMTIKTASWNAFTFGNGSEVGTIPWQDDRSITVNASTKTLLVNYQSVTTFKTLPNKIKSRLIRFSFFVDAPTTNVVGTVRFSIERASIGGAPSWTNINTNSVMQYDTAGTSTSAGSILSEYIGYAGGNKAGAVSSSTFGAESIGLVAYPGDQFTIFAEELSGAANVTCRSIINWNELF